jgi:hypothetical protein
MMSELHKKGFEHTEQVNAICPESFTDNITVFGNLSIFPLKNAEVFNFELMATSAEWHGHDVVTISELSLTDFEFCKTASNNHDRAKRLNMIEKIVPIETPAIVCIAYAIPLAYKIQKSRNSTELMIFAPVVCAPDKRARNALPFKWVGFAVTRPYLFFRKTPELTVGNVASVVCELSCPL